LPERPVEPEPSPLTRSPFATTSTVAASWWPSSSPTGGQTESPAEGATAETGETGQPVESAAGDAASGGESPAAESGTAAAPADAAAGEAIALGAPESAPGATWPAFPSYAASSTETTSSQDAAATPASAGYGPEKSGDLAAVVEESASRWLGASEQDSQSEEPAGTETSPEESAAPADTGLVTVDADDHDAPPAVATASERKPDADALARARSLLDELQSLLPLLAAPAAVAKSVDLNGIASGLTAARDEAQAQQTQIDALMSVVETAKARPRDIDVMLDLSRHVDAIVSLKAGYDRYRDATETALGQLKTD
jgi:hypothetical protein